MNKPNKVIPKFSNEAEERAFWEKHDSTEYLDWTKAKRVVPPDLKPMTKKSNPPPLAEMVASTHSVTALNGLARKPARPVTIEAMNQEIAKQGAKAR